MITRLAGSVLSAVLGDNSLLCFHLSGLLIVPLCSSWIGLPGGAFSVQICRHNQDLSVCLFVHLTFALLAQCRKALASPCPALHVRDSPSPNHDRGNLSSWCTRRPTRSAVLDCDFPRLCYDRSQLLSFPPHHLIPCCPLTSRDWASVFTCPVNIPVELGRGNNGRLVLFVVLELHVRPVMMLFVAHHGQGQLTSQLYCVFTTVFLFLWNAIHNNYFCIIVIHDAAYLANEIIK